MHEIPPRLLFYPTSPVHVRDLRQVTAKLPEWRYQAILYEPLARVAPGIPAMLQNEGFEAITLEQNADPESQLPCNAALLVIGAVFEAFGVELCAWAKRRRIPVVAIQEVAQLALNQNDINNYDVPFDRLFVASRDEYQRFIALGYPSHLLRISGLLAYERLHLNQPGERDATLAKLGIADGKNPIVYTTSPLRGRLTLHNKDDLAFREAVLAQIASASRQTGRRAIIKLHPNEEIESTRDQILKIIPDAIVIGREFHIDELFGVAGVLVNRGNSQTCLEAVLRGIPTVVAACGLATLFHKDGGAYIVNDLHQVSDTIVRACAEGPVDISDVQTRHFFLPTEGVGGFIAHELADLVANPPLAAHADWNWLIKSMLFIGRHDQALQFCKKLATPSAWQEQVCIALKAHAENRLQDLKAGWLACSAIDPNWFFPHYELAHAYQSSGEYQQAIEHAHKAIKLHPPFHALWHEIPMRVVIMASLREMGDLNGAALEMKRMNDRELVEIVPELLIEKAAQNMMQNGQLREAYDNLGSALRQLKAYPINDVVDEQIRERALARLHELGLCCERQKNFTVAEYCYSRILETRPNDAWTKFQLARIRLLQGRLLGAGKILHAISGVPHATKRVLDHALPSHITTALEPYWPVSPKSILAPLKMALFIPGWVMARIVRSGFRDISAPVTVLFLVAIFLLRHFFRRLRAESLGLRAAYRTLRNYLHGKAVYRSYEVKNCPICGGQGKFEYQNKLTPLFRCLKCDHVYARHLPDDQVLRNLYGDMSYWEKDRFHQGITSLQEGTEWDTYLNARIGILQSLDLLSHPANGRKSVFEIGCAEGMLLHALKKRGMTVAGCEMNRAVAAQGVKNLGVNIQTEPFETLAMPLRDCDLVISFHTLEHMRFPVRVLTKISQILRPDGAVLIEVPCGVEEYENTDHLHFFSETSLRLLLKKFFLSTEIIGNTYTNSGGVKIGSFYGIGHGVRNQLDDRLAR